MAASFTRPASSVVDYSVPGGDSRKTASEKCDIAINDLYSNIEDSDETTKGIIERATVAEATTGTDTSRAVTPAGVKACTDALDVGKSLVSSNDTTAGYLNGKLTAGANISLTEGSDGGDETLAVAVTGALLSTNNLSDLDTAATARTNLGIGTVGTRDTGTSENNVPLLAAGGAMPAVGLGTMTFYDHIFIPAGALIPTDTNGAESGTNEYATNDVMTDYYAFDGATEEFVAFNLPMPPGWDRSTIKAKFLWAPGDSACTAADTVEWEIAAVAISDDDAIDTSFGTAQVISDAVHTGKDADLHISGATPAITVGGTPALGDWVQFKVSRNVSGTDDMTEDAWLFGVQIQWQRTNAVAAW